MIPIEKTYTVHLPLNRNRETPPVCTIVFAKNPFEPGSYLAATAVCHDNDQFSKKLGRKIAYGRLSGLPLWGSPTELYCMLYAEIFRIIDRKYETAKDVELWPSPRKPDYSASHASTAFDIRTVCNTLDDRMRNK